MVDDGMRLLGRARFWNKLASGLGLTHVLGGLLSVFGIERITIIGDREFACPLRTDFLGAALFGCFDGQDGPCAIWALFGHRWIPNSIIAFWILLARIKYLVTPGFAAEQFTTKAFRAFHASIHGFFQRLNMLAFGVTATADKFSITPVSHNKGRTAFWTASAFDLLRFGASAVVIQISRIAALGIVCTANKASVTAQANG